MSQPLNYITSKISIAILDSGCTNQSIEKGDDKMLGEFAMSGIATLTGSGPYGIVAAITTSLLHVIEHFYRNYI